MPLSDQELWQRVAAWGLPYRAERDKKAKPPRDCTCFEHNLRKLGDYTDDSARRLTLEYRRFLYLKLVDGGILVPPGVIEQAWRLHRKMLGPQTEQVEVPWGGTIQQEDGLDEEERIARYRKALDLYRREFGVAPPDDIWPSVEQMRRHPVRNAFAISLLILAGFLLVAPWEVWLLGPVLPERFLSVVGDDGVERSTWLAMGLRLGAMFFAFSACMRAVPPTPPSPETYDRSG